MHRFHESRVPDLIVEGVTDLADRLGERGLGDRDATPHGVEEFLLADEHAGAFREVAENGPGLRPQRNGSVAGAKVPGVHIEPIRRKADFAARSRRGCDPV